MLVGRGGAALTPATGAAVLGSILPDVLNGVYLVTKNRFIEWNHQLNLRAHSVLIKKPLPMAQGFLIQAIFFLLLAIYLVR